MATRRKTGRASASSTSSKGVSSRIQSILEKRRLRGPNSLTDKEERELFRFFQSERDVAPGEFFRGPIVHRLPHGFVLLQVPPGFEEEHWELRDAGGRLIAEGGEVDWEDTRRAAANALHRYLQRAERDAVDLWSESPLTIEQLYDSGYIDSREVREWVRRTAEGPRGRMYEPIYRLNRGAQRLRLRLID